MTDAKFHVPMQMSDDQDRKRSHSPPTTDNHNDKEIGAERGTTSVTNVREGNDVGTTTATLVAPSPKRVRLSTIVKGEEVQNRGVHVDDTEEKAEESDAHKDRKGAAKKNAGKRIATAKKSPATQRIKVLPVPPNGECTAVVAHEATTVRRSGRARAPPKGMATSNTSAEPESGNETAPKPKATPKKAKAEPKGKAKGQAKAEPKPRKPTKKELWEPENLATRFSPFAMGDLTKILNPEILNRENLTDEEYDCLIALLPADDIIYPANEDVTVADGKPIINPAFFKSSFLKEGIRNYQEDLVDGKYEPEYLAHAADARKKRMAGEFDNWKEDQFEVFWGQKQKLYSDAVAGASSKIKLAEMIKSSIFKIGDIFSMRRYFSGGLVVRKDAVLEGMDPENGTLDFSYAPGVAEWHKDNVPDKTIEKVMSLQALETLLCKESGRAPEKLPNGNAWKSIRVVRKGEDIGCIFDIRVKYYDQYYGKRK